MIEDAAKIKLIAELEKTGNVYIACLKVGICRATFYRWKNDNKEFKKKADQAIQQGRENSCDIAEHSLILKAKEKNMDAIKYLLSHNSPRYKRPKTTNVIIDHRTNRTSSLFDQTKLDEENEMMKKLIGLADDEQESKDK